MSRLWGGDNTTFAHILIYFFPFLWMGKIEGGGYRQHFRIRRRGDFSSFFFGGGPSSKTPTSQRRSRRRRRRSCSCRRTRRRCRGGRTSRRRRGRRRRGRRHHRHSRDGHRRRRRRRRCGLYGKQGYIILCQLVVKLNIHYPVVTTFREGQKRVPFFFFFLAKLNRSVVKKLLTHPPYLLLLHHHRAFLPYGNRGRRSLRFFPCRRRRRRGKGDRRTTLKTKGKIIVHCSLINSRRESDRR